MSTIQILSLPFSHRKMRSAHLLQVILVSILISGCGNMMTVLLSESGAQPVIQMAQTSQ